MTVDDADLERRFGGLRRLWGSAQADRVFAAHVVVVGIGGVGSWAAEALARSGVGHLTLVDLDHVAESNINRQVHALTDTLGQAKVLAMQQRIAQINPLCCVAVVDDFLSPDNAADLLAPLLVAMQAGQPVALLDACDQSHAKLAMAAWALQHQVPFVTVGAAGGKCRAQDVEVADLVDVTHDPLLSRLRYALRKQHGAARQGKIKVNAVFSREAVAAPIQNETDACQLQAHGLQCHGYGSMVTVTATFGMVAAGELLRQIERHIQRV